MDVKAIVSQMTLEEKAALCSGKNFWHLQTPERLGIEPVMVSDGPCGIRKQADAMKYKAEKEAEAQLIRRQREAEAQKYEALQQAEARKAEAEALRFSMEQEAEGIRAKGLAEAEAIEKKAEAQKRMGEASILEMYLAALPEVVKNAAAPLSQTEKIVMYGDGNSTKLVRDIIASANQVADGMRESTGIDLQALIAGCAGGKAAQEAEIG